MLLVQHPSRESVKLKRMPNRWFVLCTLLLLAACEQVPAPRAFPRALTGYRLAGEQVLTGTALPPYGPAAARVVQLTYEGTNPLQVLVFETTGSSVAFEALQQWRAQEGKLAVHAGRYFLVARSEKPDPAKLNAFLAEFEKHLP